MLISEEELRKMVWTMRRRDEIDVFLNRLEANAHVRKHKIDGKLHYELGSLLRIVVDAIYPSSKTE